jgi:hypothetical protein
MRRTNRTIQTLLSLAALCTIAASLLHASDTQNSKGNWDNLRQLRPGQKIEVVDSSMKTLKGTFVSVSDEAISLQAGKNEQSVERAKVVRVSVRDTSHRTRNMLLGSGILGGIALAATAAPLMSSSNEGTSCGWCAAAIGAGFGGGAALGALPGYHTISRADKLPRDVNP